MDVWGMDVWRMDVWRMDVWGMDVWRMDVWRMDVWNSEVKGLNRLPQPQCFAHVYYFFHLGTSLSECFRNAFWSQCRLTRTFICHWNHVRVQVNLSNEIQASSDNIREVGKQTQNLHKVHAESAPKMKSYRFFSVHNLKPEFSVFLIHTLQQNGLVPEQ